MACRIADAERSWGPSGESSPVGPCICASPQVLLAKRKSDGTFYAVKVLQKKSILKEKEVPELRHWRLLSCSSPPTLGWLLKMSPTIESMGWMQVGSQQAVRWYLGCRPFEEGRPTSPTGSSEGPSPSPLPSPGNSRPHGGQVLCLA